MKILSNGDSNYKMAKSNLAGKGYVTYGISLASGDTSGYEVCASRSPGCSSACLYTAGMGQLHSVQQSRIDKTKFFFENRKEFLAQLHKEIAAAQKQAEKKNNILAIRLNVLSDIMWEKIDKTLFTKYPNIQYYDYTKHHKRMIQYLRWKEYQAVPFPANYKLTFSRSECNEKNALTILSLGGNITVIFDNPPLPKKWNGYRVINGDDNDLRFLDPKNVVVGLIAKGKAKKDNSGFVVPSKIPLKMIA